jgi:hypothetical protein
MESESGSTVSGDGSACGEKVGAGSVEDYCTSKWSRIEPYYGTRKCLKAPASSACSAAV